MSRSEASDGANDRVRAAVDLLARLDDAEAVAVPEPVLRQAVGAVLRLYEAACTKAHREVAPVESDVSTTTAIMLACALVRSQALTPFDFALWFSHTAATDTGAASTTQAAPIDAGVTRG